MMWALTTYFNPEGFRSRHANYQTFRDALPVPLLTIEWSPTSSFELSSEDADRVLRVGSGDLMWQKERLFNLGLAALPRECDRVVWLDCDVLFEDEDWPRQAAAALDRVAIVQLFSEVVHRAPNGQSTPLLSRTAIAASPALTHTSHRSEPPDEQSERSRLARRPSSGHAWGARRSLLEAHKFYDACVSGIGDMAMAMAALGHADAFARDYPLSPAQKQHYLVWARGFSADVQKRVGCLQGKLHHLFHGNLRSRQYRTRLHWLAEAGFDPQKDITLTQQGAWRWTRERTARSATMSRFFARRNEDEALECMA